jgi:hypothetical protein
VEQPPQHLEGCRRSTEGVQVRNGVVLLRVYIVGTPGAAHSFKLSLLLSLCRYYKPETRGLDFDGLMEDIKVTLVLVIYHVMLLLLMSSW